MLPRMPPERPVHEALHDRPNSVDKFRLLVVRQIEAIDVVAVLLDVGRHGVGAKRSSPPGVRGRCRQVNDAMES